MAFNLNLNIVARGKNINQAKQAQAPARKPLPLFAQALEEENDAQPMSQRELINMQIMETAKKNERQALEIQSSMLTEQGNIYDFDCHHVDHHEEEVSLPTKQTMTGKTKYLGQLLKAKERRDRDKCVAWENVEKQERVREEGQFQDKEKFITESYARQLELNKKEEMIVEMEEKLNQSRILSNTGMMGFYSKLVDLKGDSSNNSNDVRDQAKKTVETRTNIDKILDEKESVREVERKVKEEKKKQVIRKEMEQVLKEKFTPKLDISSRKRDQKEEEKKKEESDKNKETDEEKQQRLKREREEKIAKAKQRYQERKETAN